MHGGVVHSQFAGEEHHQHHHHHHHGGRAVPHARPRADRLQGDPEAGEQALPGPAHLRVASVQPADRRQLVGQLRHLLPASSALSTHPRQPRLPPVRRRRLAARGGHVAGVADFARADVAAQLARVVSPPLAPLDPARPRPRRRQRPSVRHDREATGGTEAEAGE